MTQLPGWADQLKALPQFEKQFPDVQFRVDHVSATFSQQQVEGVIRTLVEGIALVALVMLFFLKSRRNALVLFDKRVQAKDYGSVFLNSLPRCTTRQGSVSLVPEHVAGWMRGEPYE